MTPTVRIIDLENDHALLAKWWESHGWPVVPAQILPRLGAMVMVDDVPVAAAFLYMDNSVGVSMLEWLVTNPKATGKQTLAGIQHVIEFLGMRAVEMDYGVMLTSCRQPALVRIYEKLGFIKTDETVTHLIRKLRD